MTRFARCLMLVGALSTLALAGCNSWGKMQRATVSLNYPHATGENLTETSEEHYQRVSKYSAFDARALVDDLDLLFLTERQTRLTKWHVP